MDPRERLFGMVELYLQRGEPIPLTLLCEAVEQGLFISELGYPTNPIDDDGELTFDEGDDYE